MTLNSWIGPMREILVNSHLPTHVHHSLWDFLCSKTRNNPIELGSENGEKLQLKDRPCRIWSGLIRARTLNEPDGLSPASIHFTKSRVSLQNLLPIFSAPDHVPEWIREVCRIAGFLIITLPCNSPQKCRLITVPAIEPPEAAPSIHFDCSPCFLIPERLV